MKNVNSICVTVMVVTIIYLTTDLIKYTMDYFQTSESIENGLVFLEQTEIDGSVSTKVWVKQDEIMKYVYGETE